MVGYADYCSDCTPSSSDHVHDYSYKPTPLFHGTGPVFLGLELELKTSGADCQDCALIATRKLGRLGYLKDDGSIGYGRGFEMVTHPMSYRYAIEQFPWDLLPQLEERGAYIDGDVGIHVHVSRAGFASPVHVYRWMKFFYRNESHITEVARRASDEWAAFAPQARAGIVDFAKGNDDYGLGNGGRYQAINTLPEHTFEVRIFASSLIPQQVQAALALIAASVEYTRTLTSTDITRRHGWEWTAFVTWLRAHPDYAPLLAELEDLACAS
ncbi:amidoligase family protein [Nocardia sp. CA2R105]|nr:amidoligase family protein [Nocardia coffeae]